jgi:amino acid adenylation domain-containing protein
VLSDTDVVHELFEDQVRRTPDAVALTEGAEHVTYQELNRRANQLAHHLVAAGVRQHDIVGVHLVRSADLVVAMLAVLKAGAAYLPLEPALPAQRRRQMLAECAPRLVITAPPLDWPDPGVRELSLRRDAALIAACAGTDPRLPVSPESLVYVPYTSGSTGRPNATGVPHRSLPGFFRGTDYGGWGPGQVALFHSSLSWDGHVLDLYPSLLTGGRVVICPVTDPDPLRVAAFARDAGVTILLLPSGAFNAVVDGDVSLLSAVRVLLTGGETMSRRHVAAALDALPDTVIVNGYGPSECTVYTCVHPVGRDDLTRASIPIGRPVGDRTVHVLAGDCSAVPDGAHGELHVGGPGVARGYLTGPRLTAERFVPDPSGAAPGARLFRTGDIVRRTPGGTLEFVGRTDDQVKIRGFRVELGEVEAALRDQPGVRDAAVKVHGDAAAGTARLVGYAVPEDGAAIDAAGLRARLRTRLLDAMVPAAILVLDRLPLNSNGKVDRDRLPRPDGASAGYVPPRTEVERCLAGVWQELFELDRVGRGDNFFDLGGHSLLATRVVSRVKQLLDVPMTVRTVYDAPVLARLAEILERTRRA